MLLILLLICFLTTSSCRVSSFWQADCLLISPRFHPSPHCPEGFIDPWATHSSSLSWILFFVNLIFWTTSPPHALIDSFSQYLSFSTEHTFGDLCCYGLDYRWININLFGSDPAFRPLQFKGTIVSSSNKNMRSSGEPDTAGQRLLLLHYIFISEQHKNLVV